MVPAANGGCPVDAQDVDRGAGTQAADRDVLNASTNREIDAVFSTLTRERPDALFVSPDAFFTSRRVQITTLAARGRIPAASGPREFVEVGGLMSYGTDRADRFLKLAFIPAKSSTALSPPTCRSNKRPSSCLPSTSKPPTPSALASRKRCWPLPMR
jgi:hypothetical protein